VSLPGLYVKLLPHRLLNRVCGIWLGVGEGAKQVSYSIRLPVVAFMKLECFTVNCVTLLLCNVRYYALFLVGHP